MPARMSSLAVPSATRETASDSPKTAQLVVKVTGLLDFRERGPMSLRSIALHLNDIGAPPPNNCSNSVTHWNPFTVRKILLNEIYAGRTYWGKTRMINGKRTYQPRERWTPIDVPELAMINRETFEASTKRFERNKQLAKRNRKNAYLMAGFMRCAECGATIVGHQRNYKSGKKGLFYRCGNSWYKFKREARCSQRSIDTVTHKIDDAVWSWLKGFLCDRETLKVGLNKMMEKRSIEAAPKRDRLTILEHLIDDEEKKIRRLISEMGNNYDDVVLDAFRAEIDQATKNHNALKEEHINVKQDLDQVELTTDHKDQIMEFASKIRDRLEDASFEEKRRVMDILDVQAIMHYDEQGKWLEATCAIPTYQDNNCVASFSKEASGSGNRR